ncbi:MAG: PQQ-binding-like beta-propeller repeat protein [Vicinamibacterales bacterium]
MSEHAFKVYCLDKATGKILWDRTAHTGAPKVKRHPKSTQANSTPATDGRRVVALFGSVGLLVAYDMSGKELWRVDFGILDSGWFFDPTYQWGHSSSPIIYKNSVIVQADRQKQSYVAAWDLAGGKQLWRTDRDEIPIWGTPTLVTSGGRDELVANNQDSRLRPGDREAPLDARTELRSHRRDARGGRRCRVRHRRLSSRAAHLCHQNGSERRHLVAGRPGIE